MRKRNFTQREIEILKNNEYKSISYITSLLNNREVDVVREKMKSLGLKYEDKQNRWGNDELNILNTLKENLKLSQVIKLLPDKNEMQIKSKCSFLNIHLINDLKRFKSWEEYEDNILRENSNGVSTYEKIEKLLPHRTKSAIRGRLNVLNLRISDPNYLSKCYSSDYRTINSQISRYRTKYGIILVKDTMYGAYDEIQWWKWMYYETPNNKKLDKLPLEIYENKESLKKIARYVIINEVGFKTREDILCLDNKAIAKYKINFHWQAKNRLIDYINLIFPEYNIKSYELKNVPLDFWKYKNNADEYMRNFIENEIMIDTNFKINLPKLFTYENIRNTKYSGLASCLSKYKYYNSFYDWLNSLYPEWNLNKQDFKECVGSDGVKLNSYEEVSFYNFVKDVLNISIKAIGMKKDKKYKYFNESENENYIPDFIIKNKCKKDIIIEYYGLYREDYGNSKILKAYYEKTHRKNKYYKSRDDIYFLDFYPKDLENAFKGVREKLTSFLMSKTSL